MVECVAEFTTNHMGNLNVLLNMVDAAATAGADSVKMQRKDVEGYYTPEKLDSEFLSPYGTTYRDYREAFEFSSRSDWQRFAARCRARSMPWFVTIQDKYSIEEAMKWFCSRYKVSSSNARNFEFLRRLADIIPHGCEIVISVAGSTLAEIEEALGIFQWHRKVWLLHCVAQYPCPVDDLRLGNIPELKKRFETGRIRIGYSGHEVGFQPTLAAVDLGAEMVERHFCLSRHSFVHHIACSLEPQEFLAMTEAVRRDDFKRTSLPISAYRSSFGMTERERPFLVDQTYGTDLIGDTSRFGP